MDLRRRRGMITGIRARKLRPARGTTTTTPQLYQELDT
jgi:hypothetical protein